MKIRVDGDLCTGHGRCYMLAPEVYGEDERGHCAPLVHAVPAELREGARTGADACPEQAIELVEERNGAR